MSAEHEARPEPRALRLLLTGFGPFPGVTDNLSGGFARDLGALLHVRHPAMRIEVLQLETVWDQSARDLTLAMRALEPDLVLMFGVSSSARGLVIERQAFNACASRLDAAGCLPPQATVDLSNTDVRRSSLPIDDIVIALADSACPVSQSDDPGRYLCNAVLFEALKACALNPAGPLAGFIHLPLAFTGDGAERTAALDAAAQLADVCFAHLNARG